MMAPDNLSDNSKFGASPVGRPRNRQVSVCEWSVISSEGRKVFTSYDNALDFASENRQFNPKIAEHRWYVRDWEITRTPEGLKWTKFEIRSMNLPDAERKADERITKALLDTRFSWSPRLVKHFSPHNLDLLISAVPAIEIDFPEDTVRDIVERYQDRQRSTAKLAESTYTTHRGILDTWIDRKFHHKGEEVNIGRTEVSKVTQPLFESWLVMLSTSANKYGRTNSLEMVKLAISVLRVAWSELDFDQDTREIFRALTFNPRRLATFLPAIRGTDEQSEIKQRARDAFDVASIRRLIEVSEKGDPINRAILALALLGIRSPSEVAGARWEDFEDELGVTWFQPVRSIVTTGKGALRKVVVGRTTKTGASDVRTIPLSKWQKEAIEALPNRSGYILGTLSDPAHPDFIRARFDKLMELAEVHTETQALSINSCRHTVITHIKRLDDGDRRARLIGHAKKGRDMVAKHYDRNTRSDHRQLLMIDDQLSVMDLMPWWNSPQA